MLPPENMGRVLDSEMGIWRFQMQCGGNGWGYYIAQSNWVTNIRQFAHFESAAGKLGG